MGTPDYSLTQRFLAEVEATALMFYCMSPVDLIPWTRFEGVPRWECWMNDFGRPYSYGAGSNYPGRTYQAVPWDREIRLIRDSLRMAIGVHFEGCFLNRYNTEKDALDWHADNDPGIDHTKPIAVVSLGDSRLISVRSNDKSWHNTYMLNSGSLFLMPPLSQFTHQHKIPKPGRACGPRVSLTFRSLLKG